MKPMDFEKIRARLDKLVAEGRKGELRGALSMLNEVDIAEYMEELDNEKMLMVFQAPAQGHRGRRICLYGRRPAPARHRGHGR